MKIIHCCLACFYIDNYSYQENILPRYHKQFGNEVLIVASTESFDKDGNFTYVEPGSYENEDGIQVVRLPYVKYMPHLIARKLRRYIGLKSVLESYAPDFIFLHDVQFMDIDVIKKYADKNNVKIVADCHADFSNSARNWFSKNILHGIIYKHCAKLINPYVTKFYGVLPARVDFLRNVYKMPCEKTELLVMGAEDEKAALVLDNEYRNKIREGLGLDSQDFVIVFGGKIDNAKKQVLLLMDAVNNLVNIKVKLIVFGSIVPELKSEVNLRCSERVKYIGWANVSQSYDYFGMADVVCFPGRHSVYWEQVAGMGIPMIVKYWEGTTHVNVDGNVVFIKEDSSSEITNCINQVYDNFSFYKNKAENVKNQFMYSSIARKPLIDIGFNQ